MNPKIIKKSSLQFLTLAVISLLFVLSSCSKVYHPYSSQVELISIDTSYDKASDPSMNSIIAEYKETLDVEMNAIIGRTQQTLEKAQPEGRLGNFAADLILDYSRTLVDGEVQFAVANYGGLRIPDLPKGFITRGKIYELMPFDNFIVVLEIPGSVVRQFCDRIAFLGGWPISRGIEFKIDRNKAVDIKVNGEALDDSKIYRIGTVDYVANGGDDCYFLKDYAPVAHGTFFRDLILEEFERKNKLDQTINAEIEKRITIVE